MDLKHQLQIARNRTVSLKRELKCIFFRSAIEDAKGDSGKLWKVLKSFLKNNKSRENNLSINGKDYIEDIVEEINNFFATIGKDLAEKSHQVTSG